MRKLYTVLIAVLAASLVSAQTVQPKPNVTNADWAKSGDWLGNKSPKNGDIVEIPAGKTVSVNANFTHTTMRINVSGTLSINAGSLNYTENTAVVNVREGGIVQSFNRVEGERILIASVVKLQGDLFYLGNEQNHQGKVVGPAYATSSTGSGSSGFSFGVLPVVLSNFSVSAESETVLLQWKTDQESNSHKFDVERSADGVSWKQIGSVNAAGTSSSAKHYSYKDVSANTGINYYRLKMVDNDGAFKYSLIKAVHTASAKSTVKIFPNPATNTVKVYVNGAAGDQDIRVTVLNKMGQVMQQNKIAKGSNIIEIDVRKFTDGKYIVQVSGAGGFSETHSFLIARK